MKTIKLGNFTPKISVQLKEAGFTATTSLILFWQRLDHSITLLRMADILTRKQTERCRRKLLKQINAGIEKIEDKTDDNVEEGENIGINKKSI